LCVRTAACCALRARARLVDARHEGGVHQAVRVRGAEAERAVKNKKAPHDNRVIVVVVISICCCRC
jgi:hypothetical protein